MALFVLSLCPFDISVGVGAFVIGLSQISSFFSFKVDVIIINSDNRVDYRSCTLSFYTLVQTFLRRCTLSNKAVGTTCILRPCANLLRGDRVLLPVTPVERCNNCSGWLVGCGLTSHSAIFHLYSDGCNCSETGHYILCPHIEWLGAYQFYPVSLSVVNFNLRYSFWTARERTYFACILS